MAAMDLWYKVVTPRSPWQNEEKQLLDAMLLAVPR
jgi:hypothetical protein